MAKEFLYAVKQRLTAPQWIELQRRYAPVEGFKATAEKWTQDAIYIERDSGEKDPTRSGSWYRWSDLRRSC
jgi:hypothetical protein